MGINSRLNKTSKSLFTYFTLVMIKCSYAIYFEFMIQLVHENQAKCCFKIISTKLNHFVQDQRKANHHSGQTDFQNVK